MHLPEILRPTVISLAEDEPATAIGDINVFLETFKMPTIGVYLENSTVQYDLRRFQKNTLIVDADLGDISDDCGERLLDSHGDTAPVLRFRLYTGGIGVPESHHRQIWHQHNGNWVGRDTRRYIPGLYWWTLLPASLAEQHGIPLSILVRAAQEHIELEGTTTSIALLREVRRIGDLRPSWRNCTIRVPGYLTSRSCGQNFKE